MISNPESPPVNPMPSALLVWFFRNDADYIQTVTVEEELYEFSMHVSFLSMRNKGLYEVDRDAYLNDRRHLSEFEA